MCRLFVRSCPFANLLVGCVALLAGPPATPLRAADLPQMIEDAELADVHFVDASTGWAVGDRGVIWSTVDGGQEWHRQDSPVNCRLNSIHFVDREHGWIVGGHFHPYTHRSTGVVLRTRDGGRSWVRAPNVMLPYLTEVQFLTPSRGWAVGYRSSLFTSAVFFTHDGGRSWAPLPAGDRRGWNAMALTADGRGALAGADGRLAVLTPTGAEPSQTPDLGHRSMQQLQLTPSGEGWLAGDGGLVLRTQDGGRFWVQPESPIPAEVREGMDFRALAVLGHDVWMTGAPGSLILHSPDGGASWSTYPTGQSVPLLALHFIDREQGWAVGSLGTILVTRDGGRSWHRQRGGGTRVAWLALMAEAARIPWEMCADAGALHGYLGHVELLAERGWEAPRQHDATLAARAHAGVVRAGGCGSQTTWRFPLRQRELEVSLEQILEAWNRRNDSDAAGLLEEYAVRRIRQWRPEIVVTEPPDPHGRDPLGHLVNQLVLAAVEKAGDPTMYPEHAAVLQLSPWQVKRVFAATSEGRTIELQRTRLAPHLATTLGELADSGRRLVESSEEPELKTAGLDLLLNRQAGSAVIRDAFGGLYLATGGEARRDAYSVGGQSLDDLRRVAQRRRNVEQLVARAERAPGLPRAWLGEVESLTRGLPRSASAQLLYDLAQHYRAAGEGELAAWALEQMVKESPNHPLAESALLQLVQYYASGEIAWNQRRATRFAAQQVVHRGSTTQEAAPAVLASPATSGSQTTAAPGAAAASRAVIVTEWGQRLQRTRPEFFAEPALRFSVAAALRDAGLPGEAEKYYRTLVAGTDRSAWHTCAEQELWLKHATGGAPRPVVRCRAASRPHLDGKLDDATWQSVERLELSSRLHDDNSWPAEVRVAGDREYLYLAATCRKPSGLDYTPPEGTRSRDADLSQHDRIELLLDIDRDYGTFYRLQIDHRGSTAETCVGDPGWNPDWYVASHQDSDSWTVEAAIPWTSLAPEAPTSRDAWCIGLQRVVPRVGFQSLTFPAAVVPRGDGLTLLLFE